MSYDHAKQQSENALAAADPQPGDYWSEMFCPYFMVLERIDDHVLICGPKDSGPNHWTMDVDKAHLETIQWLNDRVKYKSVAGFSADVKREWGAPFVKHHLGFVPWEGKRPDELCFEEMP